MFDAISEEQIKPVLELLQGGDPDLIAKNAGISKERLFKLRDELLARAERQKAAEQPVAPLRKVGRNQPCPCGSGKKYKHCCIEKHEAAKQSSDSSEVKQIKAREKEQKQLIDGIDKAFGLLASGLYHEAIRSASKLLKRYPNEDRLHDIVASSYMYAKESEKAIEICRCRWETAKSEKAYFVEHGRYRDAEVDKPALSYYYPPMTWLQKLWVALKYRDYQALYPESEDPDIVSLISTLQTADNPISFPEKHSRGLEIRKTALKATIDRLKAIGPQVVPYLLPLACKYSWTGLFVPEILFSYKSELAIRSLIDISMFGFAYASGASLHYLEQLGEEVIPYIEEAFNKERTFDPIKTGIVSVLGNVRVPAAYELLLRLLDHNSPHIVNWAGDALGKFNNPRALPAMVAANKRIGGEQMIDAAIQKLKNL
ncbi:MAG: SEC-C domain-containing protein [Deltaproteobacteria bacterium]|nr:SEC-C domain-containing protein [Deltaproteobacteria bacterium]MBW1959875.1 SEC-C domain-containing protein [Deltaproteobacteria bacterium]MBW1993556.1 SEC-C domain-containing protein [Deltaproteobacteria bacterium]MBW2150389.1 SEC-C domain-containing protein [Deltaproteobacteria bacterium]